MSFKKVDNLSSWEVEPGDLINNDKGEIILVQSIDILDSGYQINYLDEYDDDTLVFTLDNDDTVSLYIYDDS